LRPAWTKRSKDPISTEKAGSSDALPVAAGNTTNKTNKNNNNKTCEGLQMPELEHDRWFTVTCHITQIES
jgi:hypothetical protein